MRLGTRLGNATRREELDHPSVGIYSTGPSHRGHVRGVYFQNMTPAVTKVQVRVKTNAYTMTLWAQLPGKLI